MSKKEPHEIFLSNKTIKKLVELQNIADVAFAKQKLILETIIDEKGVGEKYTISPDKTKLIQVTA